jgi:hypothetical protein
VKAVSLAKLKGLVVLASVAAIAAWVVSGDPSSAGPPDDATYVGARKCRPCHFKKYKRWRGTKHASAWDDMSEKERARITCRRCHVTGYGRTGGYVSLEMTPALTGVACEACHGAGSAHIASVKNEEPEAKFKKLISKVPGPVCTACHDPHKTHEDYEKETVKDAEAAAAKARAKAPAPAKETVRETPKATEKEPARGEAGQ